MKILLLPFFIILICSGCSSIQTVGWNDYQQYQINQLQSSQWQNNFNQDYYKNVQEPANNWYKDSYNK